MLLQIILRGKGRRLDMKKQELINAVAEKTGTTKKDARAVLEQVFEVFEDALVAGQRVPMGDLGRLEVTMRKERNGTNPSTGESMVIPAANVVKYRPSKNVKELVN